MATDGGTTYLLDLLAGGGDRIEKLELERHRVVGPAVVWPKDCLIEGLDLELGPDGTLRDVLWGPLEAGRSYYGIVTLDGCRFHNCTFVNVGFAFDEPTHRQLLAQIG